VALLAACDLPGPGDGAVTRVDHGFDPDAMIVGDVDGDGVDEVVAVSGGLRTLAVLWGRGGRTVWSLPEEAAGVAIGDFDGDGRVDVATALPAIDAVALLIGRDDGLAAVRTIAVGRGPRAVLAVQLDEDPARELVVANTVDGTVSVVDERIAGPAIVVGAGPRGLAGGDLNGDGLEDVAVALADVDRVQLLLGTGDGGLALGEAYAVGVAPQAVVIGEFDGAAGLDVVTLDALGATISVLRGDGAGGLRGRDRWATPAHPAALAAVGATLAVLSRETGTVMTIDAVQGTTHRGMSREAGALAGGAGLRIGGVGRTASVARVEALQFEPAWTGPWVGALQPVDVDGDGIDEVLVAVDDAGRLEWWRDGARIGAVDPGLGAVFTGVSAVDVTGQGRRDLVVWSAAAVAVLRAAGDGTFVATDGPLRSQSGVRDVAFGDVDGDGRGELLILGAANHGGASLALFAVGGDRAMEMVQKVDFSEDIRDMRLVEAGGGPGLEMVWQSDGALHVAENAGRGGDVRRAAATVGEVILADLDDDGRIDGVACEAGLRVYRDVLADTAGATEQIATDACSRVDARDIDGDGDVDLLVSWMEDDPPRFRVVPWAQEDGAFVEKVGDAVVFAGGADGFRAAQLDGDGTIDVVYRDDDGHVAAMRGAVRPALAEAEGRSFGGGAGDVLADVDDDGAIDVVAVGDGALVAYGDGAGGFGPAQARALDAGRGAARIDVDGDGRGEVVVLAAAGLVTLDGVVLADAAARLAGADRVVMRGGDVDGDGAMDVVSVTGKTWAVNRGNGDGTLAAPVSGTSSSLRGIAVADTDGDGRSELIARRGATAALWRVRWTEKGFTAAERWLDGVAAEQVAVGDVDGDLVPDAALVVGGSLVLVNGRGVAGPPWPTLLADVGRVAIADVDGDGAREIVVIGRTEDASSSRTRLRVGRRAGDGWVFGEQEVPVRGAVDAIEVHDVDGDGLSEVALLDAHGVTIVRAP